jgi:hypothetical protein
MICYVFRDFAELPIGSGGIDETWVRGLGGIVMEFYTAVLRRSGEFWVALCLENGVVGQGNTKENAIQKLREAIQSFQDV